MSDARRLGALEDENGKLKKLLAEAMLERDLVRHWSEDNVERDPEGCRGKKMVAPASDGRRWPRLVRRMV